jgi:HEPN domain-containing protein
MSSDTSATAARWLRQAREDHAAATTLAGSGFHAQACFLAQQSAEKCLKALLYFDGAAHVLGHSVRRLCDDVAVAHPELADQCAEWADLDQYYIPTRYPDALPDGTAGDLYRQRHSSSALTTAASALAAVAELVSS